MITCMERRYQVFISSTFADLAEERQEVMQALLEMDCIPAGMELFPATNNDQWSLIQEVIEQSDYYIVIVGGRYGSTTAEGVSYTEKEYDYAIETGVPVIGFVHADPESIPVGKTDKDKEAAEKLELFTEKVEQKLVRYWHNAEDLGSKVTRALMRLQKSDPRPGWVRGDHALTPEMKTELAELREQVARMEKESAEAAAAHPTEINRDFAYGSEEVFLAVTYGIPADYGFTSEKFIDLKYPWDEIITLLCPFMMNDAAESSLRSTLENHLLRDMQANKHPVPYGYPVSVTISDNSWGQIMVQLRALGMISIGTNERNSDDRRTYWRLTPAGEQHLIELSAVKDSLR